MSVLFSDAQKKENKHSIHHQPHPHPHTMHDPIIELDELSLSGGQGEYHKFSSSIIDAEQPQAQQHQTGEAWSLEHSVLDPAREQGSTHHSHDEHRFGNKKLAEIDLNPDSYPIRYPPQYIDEKQKEKQAPIPQSPIQKRWRKFTSYIPTVLIMALIPLFISILAPMSFEWYTTKTFMSNSSMAVPFVALCFMGILLLLIIVFYFSNSRRCDTLKHMDESKFPVTKIESEVNGWRSKVPHLEMHVECYHYENCTQHVWRYDAKGKTYSTLEYQHTRVVKFRETRVLPFARMADHSRPFTIDGMCTFLQLRVHKAVSLGDEQTRLAVENAKSKILWDNHHRDSFISYKEEYVIDGYRSAIDTEMDQDERPPFYGKKWFWLFTLLGFTLPYRIYIDLQHQIQEYWITKTVSVLPHHE